MPQNYIIYMVIIRDLPKPDRPREKLIKYGPGRLADFELLAILLRTAPRGQNVLELSRNILRRFPDTHLVYAEYADLLKIKGLGAAKTCEILAALELGKRLLKNKKSALIISPVDVWNELRDIRGHKKEHFIVFYLDSRNQEIKREIISLGTLTANLVHPREVFEPAIKNPAAQILIAHNHPSGIPDPSDDDLIITKKLVEAGKILDIAVIDHIIVSNDKFYSFKEHNLLY